MHLSNVPTSLRVQGIDSTLQRRQYNPIVHVLAIAPIVPHVYPAFSIQVITSTSKELLTDSEFLTLGQSPTMLTVAKCLIYPTTVPRPLIFTLKPYPPCPPLPLITPPVPTPLVLSP